MILTESVSVVSNHRVACCKCSTVSAAVGTLTVGLSVSLSWLSSSLSLVSLSAQRWVMRQCLGLWGCGWRVVIIDANDCWAVKRHVRVALSSWLGVSDFSTVYRAECVGSVRCPPSNISPSTVPFASWCILLGTSELCTRKLQILHAWFANSAHHFCKFCANSAQHFNLYFLW